jgi:alternate signal-mediated exported protein
MNRVTKGAIAIAAGVVLLGGGAGSLAYWQTSQSAGSVSVGVASFALDRTGPPTYTVNGVTTAGDDVAFKPGDRVVYRVPYAIAAEGGDIHAKAAVVLGTASAKDASGATVDPTTITPTVTYALVSQSPGLTVAAVSGTGAFSVAGSGSAELSVILEWPGSDTWAGAAGGSFEVSASSITLTQIAGPLQPVAP